MSNVCMVLTVFRSFINSDMDCNKREWKVRD